MKKPYKRPKHPLNIFKYGYYGGILNIKHNFIQFFRNLRGAYQRSVWGFAEVDTWNLDNYFLELFYQSLTYFSQHLHSYPTNFDKEKWSKYLNKMIAHFYNAKEEHEDTWASIKQEEAFNVLDEVEELIIDKDGKIITKPKAGYTEEDVEKAKKAFYEATRNAYDFREQEMHYGIDMLEEVFFSLWD